MIDIRLLIPIIIGFVLTLFILPFWIRKARQIGLVWDDMNKISKEKVAGSGGIIVSIGFLVSVFLFIAFRVFILRSKNNFLLEIFASLVVVLLLAGVGLMDDLLGWRHGGLSRRSRILLIIIASIPLIAINAGKSDMGFPFIGSIDLGLLYPLIIIPIGVLGATTTFNFLAGFNGLEAGQGIIILSGLAIVSFLTGNSWLSVIALCMIFSLLAFLIFNFCPAKIFPGNVLTYSVGGLIAAMAILGNFEKIGVFFFIPYGIEVLLKLRGLLKKQSFGLPSKNGTLDMRYDKVYSLNHLSIFIMSKLGIRATEKKVVFSIWAFQIMIILLGFLLFKENLFI